MHIGNDIYIWDGYQHNWLLDSWTNTDSYHLLHQTGDLHLMGDLRVGGRTIAQQRAIFKNDVVVEGRLLCHHLQGHDRGFFATEQRLHDAVPMPKVGDWALVGVSASPQIWQCTQHGVWEMVGTIGLENAFDLDKYDEARDIVDDIVAQGYVFAGVADTTTQPHCPDGYRVFYITSQPGRYVHFDNMEVKGCSVLMWNPANEGPDRGMWTAKAVGNFFLVNTENLADGAVTLEKTTGLTDYVDTKMRTAVKSISVNGGTAKTPNILGHVNLVIGGGGSGDEDDPGLVGQVRTNTSNLERLMETVEGTEEEEGLASRFDDLETTAIRGIKVNGQDATVTNGVANVTIREQQERAASGKYRASVVDGVTRSGDTWGRDIIEAGVVYDVEAEQSYQFPEEGEDDIEYRLVVDTHDNSLLVEIGTRNAGGGYDYAYYSSWNAYGNDFPGNEDIVDNEYLIKYRNGGVNILAEYDIQQNAVEPVTFGLAYDVSDASLLLDFGGTYYLDWEACDYIASNADISENAELIQYKVDGTTYLGTYDITTHKVKETGGQGQAIGEISATSDRAVQSKVLREKFDEIDGNIRILEDVAGAGGGNSSFNLLSDSDEAFSTFSYFKGNPGCFTPKVAPEDITVDDVRTISVLRPPYGYRTIGAIPVVSTEEEKETVQGIWTAAMVGLSDEANKGVYNRDKIRDAIANPNCIGIKLDKVYEVYCTYTNYTGVDNASDYNCATNIVIDKPFIIDGEVNGMAVGGLKAVSKMMLYTNSSLYLHKVNIENDRSDGFYTIFVDVKDGIDQLQIIKCNFTSTNGLDYGGRIKSSDIANADFNASSGIESPCYAKGRFVYISADKTVCPYVLEEGEEGLKPTNDETRKVNKENGNYINHIRYEGNTFSGGGAISADGVRIVKSCVILHNTFSEITSVAVKFSLANGGGNYKATCNFMSCPIYVVGNTFTGYNKVFKSFGQDKPYYGGIMAEYNEIYVLHNRMENFISGHIPGEDSLETYDAYLSSRQAYFCNNYVKNIVRFNPDDMGGVGICKGKNTNDIYIYGGGRRWCPFRRYWKSNTYILDHDEVMAIWRAHMDNLGTECLLLSEIAYDQQVSGEDCENLEGINDMLAISFANETSVYSISKTAKDLPILWEYVFSNNVLKADKGGITGKKITGHICAAAEWPASLVDISNNTFRAKWFAGANNTDSNRKHLFQVRLMRHSLMFESTSLNIVNNRFEQADPDTSINYPITLIANSYPELDTTNYGTRTSTSTSTETKARDTTNPAMYEYGNYYSNPLGDVRKMEGNVGVLYDTNVANFAIVMTTSRLYQSSSGGYHNSRGSYATAWSSNEKESANTENTSEELRTLRRLVYGDDVSNIPTIIPENPTAHVSQYKVVDGSNITVYTCQAAGSYARVSLYAKKSASLAGTVVDLSSFQIPLSEYETLSLTSDQIAEVLEALGLPTEDNDVAITTYTIAGNTDADVSTEIATLLSAILKACDFTQAADNTTTLSSGTFSVYKEGSINRFVLIAPKYVAQCLTYIKAQSETSAVTQLAKIVDNSSSASKYGVAYYSSYKFSSKAGTDPDWGDGEPAYVGLLERVAALEGS